ncbi:DUF6708 domain-containing protein [Xenorhabdus entomophaga]|uniref:DUF6708 domain-containing protein n=1 Tax=Xenorhabdus entomophaga TaxID=3136257 RepID=UPI0030F4615E
MVVFSFVFSVFCFYFLYKEWLTLTHCPVRYNRRSQMIHAFKFNGEIISFPWKSVFFTAQKSVGTISSSWMINGHILAEDGETVIDTFGTGIDGVNRTELSQYWEFIRCYMEEDCLPELADTIKFCLPISDRRESYIFGLQYMLRLESRIEWPLLLLKGPFSLLTSIHRYFLMRTCKMPKWTAEIEKDCQIISDDPINVSAENNPHHMWRLVLANQCLEEYNQLYQREEKAQLRIKEIIKSKYDNEL